MHDPLIVAAANHAPVLVEDSRGNTVQAWLLHATPSRVRVCFTNGTSGTIPRTHVRLHSPDTTDAGSVECAGAGSRVNELPAPTARPIRGGPTDER